MKKLVVSIFYAGLILTITSSWSIAQSTCIANWTVRDGNPVRTADGALVVSNFVRENCNEITSEMPDEIVMVYELYEIANLDDRSKGIFGECIINGVL